MIAVPRCPTSWRGEAPENPRLRMRTANDVTQIQSPRNPPFSISLFPFRGLLFKLHASAPHRTRRRTSSAAAPRLAKANTVGSGTMGRRLNDCRPIKGAGKSGGSLSGS